ncbi:hypothetical protein BLNAU_18904 [Blattamonas nauphoetae]|uniref:Uncharacterized protein n=1 Tax=Blattamonas nauphoetae TaxID=2049346 RepID=A0ABQ9X315_9EUKA|nr:hypothetical protein BLNAU_18904 [Blattamonas nauphoetae]
MYQFNPEESLNKPYREDARKAMDEVALSSSSPPFILTSHLVCPLTDNEIIDIVDRIVALLKSDSPLDDDTILRICAFHKHQLSRVHLPDLFRQAGRSTEQYLHAFECLLSLPIDYLDRSPINHLLTTGWNEKPTMDEWDDVDFERVGIVKRLINQKNLPIAKDSTAFIQLLLPFIFGIMPRAHLCAARLCQSQLDRLLAPSVDFLCQFYIHPPNSTIHENEERKEQFVDICELCDQRVIAQCFCRAGFFSRFVTELFDDNCHETLSCFDIIIKSSKSHQTDNEGRKSILHTIPHFVEEGFQDALEFLFVKRHFTSYNTHAATEQMMTFCGVNSYRLCGYDAIF